VSPVLPEMLKAEVILATTTLYLQDLEHLRNG